MNVYHKIRVCEMNNMAKEAYLLKIQISELTEMFNRKMSLLKISAEGKTTTFGNYRLSFSVRPGAVDYSLVPQLKDVQLESYRKPDVSVSKLEFLGEINN
jgi:hypothetical protein